MLVSANLPAGIAATLPGQFRSVPVGPHALTPGACAIVMTVPAGSAGALALIALRRH